MANLFHRSRITDLVLFFLAPWSMMLRVELDMQHAVFLKSLDGKLYLAPIPKDVQHVLDVGEF